MLFPKAVGPPRQPSWCRRETKTRRKPQEDLYIGYNTIGQIYLEDIIIIQGAITMRHSHPRRHHPLPPKSHYHRITRRRLRQGRTLRVEGDYIKMRGKNTLHKQQ